MVQAPGAVAVADEIALCKSGRFLFAFIDKAATGFTGKMTTSSEIVAFGGGFGVAISSNSESTLGGLG